MCRDDRDNKEWNTNKAHLQAISSPSNFLNKYTFLGNTNKQTQIENSGALERV